MTKAAGHTVRRTTCKTNRASRARIAATSSRFHCEVDNFPTRDVRGGAVELGFTGKKGGKPDPLRDHHTARYGNSIPDGVRRPGA